MIAVWRRSSGGFKLSVSASVGGVVCLVALAFFASQYPRGAQARGAALTSAPAASGSTQVSIAKGPAAAIATRFTRDVQPLMQKYCYNCHGGGKHKGDITLDKFTSFEHVMADHATWESVDDQLSSAAMPPDDKPQPTKAEMNLLAVWVHDAINFRDCSGPRDPGKVTIRRLNKIEYSNTLRDLLGVDVKPTADFPADDTGYGFDNIADVLSMSPLLAEKYLYAAEGALDKVIVTEGPQRQFAKIEATRMTSTAGGNSVNDSAWSLGNNGELWTKFDAPATGEYEIRVRAYGIQAGPDPVRMSVRVDGTNLRLFEVKATKEKPENFNLATTMRGGEHKISVAFLNEFTHKAEKPAYRKLILDSITLDGPKVSATAVLPPPTAGHRALIFATAPKDGTEAEAARKVITKFANRAFRRPVAEDQITRLMALFSESRKAGDGYDRACKTAMTAVLCSPNFLFRIEPAPGGTKDKVFAIDDYALASRLSYFLWSTMPDDDLMSFAAAGKLRQPGVIEAQVKRMMADPKSQAFVANFAGQWLELRLLDDYEADPKRFPAFNKQLRTAMKMETEQYFHALVNEDHSVLELLDSNYTFVNEQLAAFYGLPDVKGEKFRKVTLPANSHRGGVLTMAGVLTVTAMPSRTSPVKRGKYILEEILGTPPPPPPPDVPALKEQKSDKDGGSLRQRLEAHRTDPTCASCHKRMDPLGFALENFDAIGKWRDKDGETTIDPSGVLPNGKKIGGADDLKKALLERKDDFVRCLATKMLTYAVGRGVEPYDRCTIDDVCANAKQSNYRFSSVLIGIVKSDAFQKRRAE